MMTRTTDMSDLENYAKWFRINGFSFSLEFSNGEWLCLAWDSTKDISEDVNLLASFPYDNPEEAVIDCFKLAHQSQREF
jgi:hypothetical protein